MSKQPLLSVIVPVYNAERYLDKCINSLLTQTYKNIEIILVNDGSDDGSLNICRRYEKDNKNIIVIDVPNGGAGYARNKGLDIAKGVYISFVDSDDYIDTKMYEVMIGRIRQDDSNICCCGRYDIEKGKIKNGLCPVKDEVVDNYEMLNRCFVYNNVDFAPWDKIYTKECWDNVRFPEGYICEDVYALFNILLSNNKVSLVSQPLYYYYHHLDSASTDSFNKHTFDFEHFTSLIIDKVVTNNISQLLSNAYIYRMKSLIYVVSYTGKTARQSYIKYKKSFYEYKGELERYKSFMNKRQKRIYYVYVLHLSRLYYYLKYRFSKKR